MRGFKVPRCCGRTMNVKIDLGKFLEAHCDVCDDIVYVKKSEMPRPQMIDD